LITGITGFVGSHMADYCLARGADVIGASRSRRNAENIGHLGSRIQFIETDLREMSSARALVQAARPERVFHLAAQSFVGDSWQAPAETLSTNILGQSNLLEAVRELDLPPRFLVVGSSDEYGLVRETELPIRESNPFRPLSPYAVSKVAQDMMGYQYFKSYGLPIVRARAFSHEGPRRGEVFVTSSFAKQIAEIEAGQSPPVLRVGDLKSRRDFSDVRDIVRGYWLLLERGEPGEVYNLCSGRSWAIQQVLDFLLAQSTAKDIAVEVDPLRLRPSDVATFEGDPSKAATAVGWRAEIPFERTLTELLDYWRERVRRAPR
jgi:GDP-4-dehydro-6-deoxy-D-mannose reductase